MTRYAPCLLLALSIALAGCTLQFSTVISPDGSGTQRVELGFTAEDQAALAQAGISLEDSCRPGGLPAPIPEGLPATVETRGQDLWCTTSVPFGSLEELQALLAGQPGLIINQISQEDGRTTLDVTVDLSRRLELGGERHSPPDVVWQMSLPGILVGHNADLAEGNALTWIVRRGEVRNLRAESVGEVPDLPSLQGLALRAAGVACLCGLLLLGLGYGAWRLVRRRRAGAG